MKRLDAKAKQIEILSNSVAIAANANRKLGDMSPLPKGYGQHNLVPYMQALLPMLIKMIVIMIAGIAMNAIWGELFRHNRLSKSQYRLISITTNISGIYLGQIIMGVDFRNPSAFVLALIGGFSLGFQVVNVIDRIKGMEHISQNKR